MTPIRSLEIKSISNENNTKDNKDEKTLKALRNRWGNEGRNILDEISSLKSYFRDNSIIFLSETLSPEKSMTSMLN